MEKNAGRRPTGKLESLKVKSMKENQTRLVKGGPNGPQWLKITTLVKS